MVLVFALFFLLGFGTTTAEKCRIHLGCWSDRISRAIKGGYTVDRNNAVEICHDDAAREGNSVFAVQATDWCFTAADAEQTYQKYGRADNCRDGSGGAWTNDVYKIVPCGPETHYDTARVLKVTVTSFGGETWNGDVIFKDGSKEMLRIGLHPERESYSWMRTQTVAVRNDVFARGPLEGSYRWQSVTYPATVNRRREYSFQFTSSSFILKCGYRTLITIPYRELTNNRDQFLSNIDKVEFKVPNSHNAAMQYTLGCPVCSRIDGDRFKLTDVQYDDTRAEITQVTPKIAGKKTVRNAGSKDHKLDLVVSEQVTKTKSFTHTAGASVTVGTEFKCGVPVLAEGKVSVEATVSYEFNYGTETSETKTMTATYPCIGPPKRKTVCRALLTAEQLTIPYTMIWTYKAKESCTCETRGKFEGISGYNLYLDIAEYDLTTSRPLKRKKRDSAGAI